MKVLISSPAHSFSPDYTTLQVRPQGKQKFQPFQLALSCTYWSMNPVTPAGVEEQVQRLAMLHVRDLAIKTMAVSEGAATFEIPNSLIDLLASIGASARLLRGDLEAWCKDNAALLSAFLTTQRGHEEDAKLPAKVQVLAELLYGAAAPKPSWKPAHMELIVQLMAFASEPDAPALVGDESIPARILAKVEAVSSEVVTDADAL